ncbi:nucleotide exchange factor GrpE [Parabacteroides sp. PF5-9]|uniref:nucleotide exchange factor GrpE n=1 Tax=Parabacteroides sp. PF5-9 TaxID=1742404 RepID=UPI0024754FB1|nr:nucleotide exchange factor GrpE [Parabacteroides sp. PF5-9]MDH6358529.1 molecular chaperone GrpE [Parabacteroides sp. PF5-9]
MNTTNQHGESKRVPTNEDEELIETTNLQKEQSDAADEKKETDNLTDVEALEVKYNDLNDAHLRLMAEFDNYRKRTLREKAELIKSGGESTLIHILPVVDDFERALQNVRVAEDIEAVKEGIELIYNKFISYLSHQGVKPIEAIGKPFDTEMFEAVAIIPSPEPEQKGKVLETIQTGYTLHDKVIRHAKVVVAE